MNFRTDYTRNFHILLLIIQAISDYTRNFWLYKQFLYEIVQIRPVFVYVLVVQSKSFMEMMYILEQILDGTKVIYSYSCEGIPALSRWFAFFQILKIVTKLHIHALFFAQNHVFESAQKSGILQKKQFYFKISLIKVKCQESHKSVN